MVNTNYNIVALEKVVLDKINMLGLTANLYAGVRPAVLDTKVNELIVVRVTTDIKDMSALGYAIVAVEPYIKDKGGVRDGSRLSSFYNAICTVLPYITDKYIFTYSSSTPIISDGNGFSFQSIKLYTTIKK